MPKLLFARPPADAVEERKIRKLAGARHAPADWIRRARMIALSWDGLRVPAIAEALGCSPKAVRHRLAPFAAHGLGGLRGPPRRRRAGGAGGPAGRRPQAPDRPGPALAGDRPGGRPAAGPGSPRQRRRAD